MNSRRKGCWRRERGGGVDPKHWDQLDDESGIFFFFFFKKMSICVCEGIDLPVWGRGMISIGSPLTFASPHPSRGEHRRMKIIRKLAASNVGLRIITLLRKETETDALFCSRKIQFSHIHTNLTRGMKINKSLTSIGLFRVMTNLPQYIIVHRKKQHLYKFLPL